MPTAMSKGIGEMSRICDQAYNRIPVFHLPHENIAIEMERIGCP